MDVRRLPFDAPKGFDPSGYAYVRFSSSGERVVVATERGGWAVVLDVSSGQIRRFECEPRALRAHFVSDDALLIQHSQALTLYDVASGKVLWSDPELVGWGCWLNARRVMVGLSLYDLKTRKKIRSFGPLLPGCQDGCFSPDGRFFALDVLIEGEVRKDRFVQVWEMRRETLHRLFEVEIISDGDHGVMAFSPDNSLLAVTGEGVATLFDVETGKKKGDLPGPFAARGIRFTKSGVEMVSFDGGVFRVNAKSRRVRQQFPAPEGHEFGAAAISEKGLVAGVEGAAVLLWQLPQA